VNLFFFFFFFAKAALYKTKIGYSVATAHKCSSSRYD
jgi:hypothetical protein